MKYREQASHQEKCLNVIWIVGFRPKQKTQIVHHYALDLLQVVTRCGRTVIVLLTCCVSLEDYLVVAKVVDQMVDHALIDLGRPCVYLDRALSRRQVAKCRQRE